MVQVETIMKNLQCSKEEALQIIEDDRKIDRGERMPFDLPIEQEKQAKKMANVGTRKVNNLQTTKPRKENAVKGTIIAEIAQFLQEKGYEMVEITNKERQIALKVADSAYELTLVEKRKKK